MVERSCTSKSHHLRQQQEDIPPQNPRHYNPLKFSQTATHSHVLSQCNVLLLPPSQQCPFSQQHFLTFFQTEAFSHVLDDSNRSLTFSLQDSVVHHLSNTLSLIEMFTLFQTATINSHAVRRMYFQSFF